MKAGQIKDGSMYVGAVGSKPGMCLAEIVAIRYPKSARVHIRRREADNQAAVA